MLYKEVEQYCGRSGASRLSVELPGSDIATLSWLLGRGFTLSHTRTSTYVPADMTYHLEKPLPSYYHGDWFDLEELAKWVIIHLYGFSLIQGSSSESGTIEFERREPSPRLFPSVLNFPFVKGRVLILEAWADPSILRNCSGINLLIIFTDDKSSLSNADSLPPRTDNRSRDSSHSSPIIRQERIVGCLAKRLSTTLRLRATYVLESRNSRSHRQFEFWFCESLLHNRRGGKQILLLQDRSGREISRPGDSLLIYREPTTNMPTEGIFGFAGIERVVEGKPDVVWKQLCRENPIVLEDEYMRH